MTLSLNNVIVMHNENITTNIQNNYIGLTKNGCKMQVKYFSESYYSKILIP